MFGWVGRCRTSTLKFLGGALIMFNDTTINNFYGGRVSWRESFGHLYFVKPVKSEGDGVNIKQLLTG